MTLRFGTDGVRGHVPTELSSEYVAALGRAAAQVMGGGPWLIGRDTRESGPLLQAAFADGLRAAGGLPEFANVVPTPALADAARSSAEPAAMITASHNPGHDNGVKIFAPGGLKLSDDVEAAIESAIVLDAVPRTAFEDQPRQPVAGVYSDGLIDLFDPAALHGIRIVIDCANGAMFEVAPDVLRRLGADVVVINDVPTGRNINDHCGATSPGSLAAAVVLHGADLGLAFDGDGDRVIAADHRGIIVDGDRMLALAALQLRDAGELIDDTVVVTVMSNLGFHRAMARAGIEVVMTAVGDRYVLEALDAGGYSLGGEQSGHIIYRRLATTGDGLLAGARLAHDVLSRGRPLAELAGEVMTSYPQVLVNVRVADRHPRIADELIDEINSAEAALNGEGRVLLRPSGTEPLIRVMVEAATADLARSTADGLADVVRSRFA